MGLGVMKSTLANHLMGPVQGFKMVPSTKSRLLEGQETCLAPKMAKKVSGPSKSLDVCVRTI